MVDYSIDALHCDKCIGKDRGACSADCVWIPKNDGTGGLCINKCGARDTKGECDQYHVWNKSYLSPIIYDFDGYDGNCVWHPNEYSLDNSVNSREGTCRAKDNPCFEPSSNGVCAVGTTSKSFKEGVYCIPPVLSSLGEVYCGYSYDGHHNKCYENSVQSSACADDINCEVFSNIDVIPPGQNGVCVSNGETRYDLETGEDLGLFKNDEQCRQVANGTDCMGDNGCFWEPLNEYCTSKVKVPQTNQGSIDDADINDMLSSCKPIEGHLPGDYDVNMINEEKKNISDYRDRDNNKYPYDTSKYLCDVCHIRDNDLNNMKEMSTPDQYDMLKYYMIKKYVDFGDNVSQSDRSTQLSVSAKEYCERVIDDKYDQFNPCKWTDDASTKGGSCTSKCSEHNTGDTVITNSSELKDLKTACVTDKWFPEDNVRDIEFPRLSSGEESDDDYFNDRYCTWDGFECHNSIPCKFAQQTRCEDLGYEWYQGSAIDVMNQDDNNDPPFGIKLDLSSSYPILKKGDGKPVEGDMEGICIYPNIDAGFISQPADYIIKPDYIGEQVIMIKWREYGTGWWKDMSCRRKEAGIIPDPSLESTYFLGENVALIPFKIEQGDTCNDIKTAINNALQSYQYFIYNGEWVMFAEDLIEAIDRSYDSSIDEANLTEIQKNYGYMYYTGNTAIDATIDATKRKQLNAIYDLRGAINVLPVVDGKCMLEVKSFTINSSSGNMTLKVETPGSLDKTKFQFVEFFGTDIFKGGDDIIDSKLTLTVLSKYTYSRGDGAIAQYSQLPENIVQGYGTLYENKYVKDIDNQYIPIDPQGPLKISSNGGSINFNINNIDDNEFNPDVIRKNYIDRIETEYLPDSLNELDNWVAYRVYKNNNIFSQPIVEIKDELYKLKYNTNFGNPTNKLRLCSGSLESWKIMNILTGTPPYPTYQSVKLKNVNGLLKMMAKYLDDKTVAIPGYFVPDDPYNRGETPATTIDEYIESYQQTDIKKAVLWSITRNTPPFWGNLYYERGSVDEPEPLYFNSCGNFNIITELPQPQPIYKEEFKNSIRENTLIRPFAELDGSNNYIKWKNLMSYTGGNKRAIQLSRNVESMAPKDLTDFDAHYLNIIPYIELSKKELLLRSLNDWNRLTYRDVLGPSDGSDQGCGTYEHFGSGSTLDIPNIDVNGLALKDMSIVNSYNYINSLDNFKNYFKDDTITDGILSENYSQLQGPRLSCKTKKMTGGTCAANYTVSDIGMMYAEEELMGGYYYLPSTDDCKTYTEAIPTHFTNYKQLHYNYDYDGNTINDIYKLSNPVNTYIEDDLLGTIKNKGTKPGIIQDKPGYYGWLNLPTDAICSPTLSETIDSINSNTADNFMDCCGVRTYPDCNIKVDAGGKGLPNNHIFGVNFNDLAGTFDPGTTPGATPTYNWMTGGPTRRTRVIPPNIPAGELGYPVNNNESINDGANGAPIYSQSPDNIVYYLKNDIHLLNRLSPYSVSTTPADNLGFKINEDQFYNGNYTSNLLLYNNLYYPDDFTDETPDDGLRKWCMSNDASFSSDPNSTTFGNTDYTSMNGLDNSGKKIDPDNNENSMGVLYSGWLNNYQDDFESSNKELFYSNKNDINAYKYPNICEPWRLKIGTNSNAGKAKYSNDIIFWDKDNVDDKLLSLDDNNDFSGDLLYNNQSKSWLNLDNVFDGLPSGTGDYTDYNTFATTQVLVKPGALINTDDKLNNKFYHMLYPTSIELAKPREKFIYVDITPNNDIFNNAAGKHINIYYFIENLITGYPLSGGEEINVDVGLQPEPNTIYNSIVNQYDYYDATNPAKELGKCYWLHPGLSETTSEKTVMTTHQAALIAEGEEKVRDRSIDNIGTNGIIVGYNNNSTTRRDTITLSTPSTTPNELKANQHVAYFYYVKQLTTNNKLKKVDSIYKFDNSIFTYNNNNIYIDDMSNTRDIGDTTPVTISIFYKDPSYPADYYNSRLPPSTAITKISNKLFGTGYMSNDSNALPAIDGITYVATGINGLTNTGEPQGDANINNFFTDGITDDAYVLRASEDYFNINMVFDDPNNDDTSNVNICKELIKSKLSICGNPVNWVDGCSNCFGANPGNPDNPELSNICDGYSDYIGSKDDDPATNLSVCGILNHNKTSEQPWQYVDVTLQPESFGANLPNISPYSDDNSCNNIEASIPPIDIGNIDYIPINQAGEINSGSEGITFFKPSRETSSDLFLSSMAGTDNTPIGCMREDLSLMSIDNLKISCNTTLDTPVERDKHVLINFIIAHSTDLLHTSDRTKLAIMSEEELLNKALELGISLDLINKYTSPKLKTKVKDIYIPYICEDGITPCTGVDDDTSCPDNYKCGLYEQWNDLQKYYYNIEGSDKDDFTKRKEWEYVGCGIDLNYSDNTSGELVCKDKYPGLCEKNKNKCDSKNDAIREAIMLDCPETCQVQYADLDQYKGEQIGQLSICTARGRCKWSHDIDDSNLLPLCQENTTRELGSTEKCRNYNRAPPIGPAAGSCNLDDHPETINSSVCSEQRCASMQGCEFTPDSSRYCRVNSYVDDRIINEQDCPQGGRWLGSSIGGQCIIDQKDFYDSDLQNFEDDCNVLGGTIFEGTTQSCEYKPNLPYIGEDPCSHIVDLDDLTQDELELYLYETTTNIYVEKIIPRHLDNDQNEHPNYIEIILSGELSNSNLQNFNTLTDLQANTEVYPNNKYVYIDNGSSHMDSLCSQYLLGKSKIVAFNKSKNGKTSLTIGGPNKAYILPRYTEGDKVGQIDIGNENACVLKGIYDLEAYYANNSDGEQGQNINKLKQEACINNNNGACNFEYNTQECVSCSMYKDEVSCFGNDDPNEYSRCGWGNIKDVCGVIGEMDECKKMHVDGCSWNPATETCSLNKLTDDDGNFLVDKVGCISCDDINHKNTCNSVRNCFWDGLTPNDDNIGECRACSSIRDNNDDNIGDGISVTQLMDKKSKCDDFQLTQGQCEIRDPHNRVTGLDGIFSGESSILSDWTDIFDIVFESNPFGDIDKDEDNVCKANPENCKCSPTRLYPLFPDWIIHNLIFILIFAPFCVYFGYAWWNILISPTILVRSNNNLRSAGPKETTKKILETGLQTGKAGISIMQDGGGGDENYSQFLEDIQKIIEGNSSSKKSWFSKQSDKLNNLFTTDYGSKDNSYSIFGSMILHSSSGNIVSDWVDIGSDLKTMGKGVISPAYSDVGAQFAEMIPKTSTKFKWSFGTIVKMIFLIVSLPFTIIQYISRNVRLAPSVRLANIMLFLADSVKTLNVGPIPLGLLLSFIFILCAVGLNIGGPILLISTGFAITKHLLEYGLRPNPNYVDPVDGVAVKDYPKAAVWFKTLFREEWNDMIKDPVSDAVVQERESYLPEILQGDVNDDNNVSDVYNIAYFELEPDSLDWTQRFRDIGNLYNKFINRIGDNFIFKYIASPYILYKYMSTIIDFFPSDSSVFDIKSFLIYTVLYSVVWGILSAILYRSDDAIEDDTRHDGVETKCYDDIDSPFKLGNEYIKYPKLCFDDSVNDDKEECPYGCYYYGEDQNKGKPCKDNRSVFSMGDNKFAWILIPLVIILTISKSISNVVGIVLFIWSLILLFFNPNPTLNLPLDGSQPLPDGWTRGETDNYVCPPLSRFMSKYPYDTLCSTTAKRCKQKEYMSTYTPKVDGDEYCEIKYRLSNDNDDDCNNEQIDLTTMPNLASSHLANAAKGSLVNKYNDVECEIELPYDGYKKDRHCPFPLPAAQNEFYSDAGNTRDSISVWNWLYDKYKNPGATNMCTYICDELPCNSNELTYKDKCEASPMDSNDDTNEATCTTIPLSDNTKNCSYFPEKIPLQTSVQNQERYLIVNQNYDGDLFR